MRSIYLLAVHLKNSGFEVSLFHRGDVALRALIDQPPDLAILDIMLPGVDGLEILRQLRRDRSRMLVMLASAKGAEIDRVVGLELGGDDYLVKPLSGREMVSRVKALFRRREREQTPRKGPSGHSLQVGRLTLDLDKNILFGLDGEVGLTPSEFQIIMRMMRAPGRTFTRDELGACLETEGQIHSRAVDVHIGNLRKKVSQTGATLDPIQSVRGVGYRLVKIG
jgi:DNA-binding response OmpR family regulator